ncbi:hypothetical protein [Chitinophaga alhagiae]|uniref:hypothetical protein n=1 Tax=Chitinophaga alhagiae TaxID=2203219 RepID=UPI000E5AF573|nr:hypothetical protein [Chitinophaga alhagiae]
MSYYKIFPSTRLKGKLKGIESLELSYATYLLSIVWPKNEYCLLSTLQLRFDNASNWIVVDSKVGSHLGEITIKLGTFSPEEQLQLFWIINAPLTKISALAIYLVNLDTKQMIKVKPEDGVKTIDKGKEWMDERKDIQLF